MFFHFQGLLNEEKNASFFFTGVIKISTSSKTNHYDTPKIHNNDENVILKLNNDVEKTIVNEQNNNMTTNDKVRLYSLCIDFFLLFFFFLSGFFTHIKRTR
jgi:hypothetical protein